MVLLLPLLLLALMLTAQPQAGVLPPVARMDVTGVQARAFEASSVRSPLVISSLQEAAIYLPAQDLARLSHEVDFSRQVLLVFAWRGSGQDRLEYQVHSSPPGVVAFLFSSGRTRDLREHQRVFVLRSHWAWSVR
jgi:hypothetical protein